MLLRAGSTCWRIETATRAAILMDVEDYYLAARAAMLRARASIHLLNWAFEPETTFAPNGGEGGADAETGDTFGGFLRALATERPGLDVRLLCWQSALPIAATQNFFPLRARECFAGSGVKFRLDGALPMGASHHQKMIVIDDAVAFCGGADIGPDRWDTTEHGDDHPGRRRLGGRARFFEPRHEVMALVEGPPAAALGALFRERWRRGTGEIVAAPTLAPADGWPDEVAADFRDIAVGLARTAPAWRGQPEVRENERLYLAAIAAARHCIYLENQYLTSPVIAEALGQRLAEPDGPEIVLISTRHSPSYFDRLTMDRTRGVVLRRLRRADTGGRLKAYSPVTARGRAIIVHAKVAIIDDRLLRVGSSNLNNRSTGLDSECDLALEASRAADRQRIGGIRDRLVGHWLGVPGKAIANAVAASGGLGAAIEALRGQGRERLVPIVATRAGPLSLLIAAFHLGDPVSTADSWRPWTRRRTLRRDLMRAADRLALDRMPHPHDTPEEELV